MKTRCLAVLLLCLPVLLPAGDPPPDAAAKIAELEKTAAGLKLREGETVLGNGLAKISVPPELRYLDAKDSATVLTALWNNPQDDSVLGALVPADFDPLGGSWMVVISFDEDGYIKDDDAASIDYAKLLDEMKEGTRKASEARQKQGLHTVELVGWAKPPRYDAAAHKLYWAKELKFSGTKANTLNYNIRILGRRGVLVLNAVAGMPQLEAVEKVTPKILASVNFQEGHRYADFDSSTDKVATYGLAALVAGGIAAKTGFLKALWLGILAFKKFILIALVALAGYAKKLWAAIRGDKGDAAGLRAPADASATALTTPPPAAPPANPSPGPTDSPPPASGS